MRESTIECYLRREVHRAGGRIKKLAGQMNDPDRLVLWPGGLAVFVELKAPGKKPRPGQARELYRLRVLGFEACVVDCKACVDLFVSSYVADRQKSCS